MSHYIALCAKGDEDNAVEVPVEEDNTLLLSTVCSQFPGATGLRFKATDAKAYRGLRLEEGRISLPDDFDTADHLYEVVFPKEAPELKRPPSTAQPGTEAKQARFDASTPTNKLIVLGLPFSSTKAELESYFVLFGPLVSCEVKRDHSGRSRGFGFVQFCERGPEDRVLKRRYHEIDGRQCEVKYPDPLMPTSDVRGPPSRKIFVGQVPEELTVPQLEEHFSQFGTVKDVYIPTPHRKIAFVTFDDPRISVKLYGTEQEVDGHTLWIKPANPKPSRDDSGEEAPPASEYDPRFPLPAFPSPANAYNHFGMRMRGPVPPPGRFPPPQGPGFGYPGPVGPPDFSPYGQPPVANQGIRQNRPLLPKPQDSTAEAVEGLLKTPNAKLLLKAMLATLDDDKE